MNPEPFIPDPLPRTDIDWTSHISLIGSANAALARFDGLLRSIQNPDLLLTPLITQEAVISSRIEGTQATMREVYIFEAGTPAQTARKHEDIRDVMNYKKALEYAKEEMKSRHLSWNMILHLHSLLLDGVRGSAYQGTIRTVQNYIGPIGQVKNTVSVHPPDTDCRT